MRRRTLAAGFAALALTLTACTAPHPQISFYSNHQQVSAGPIQWCTVSVSDQVSCPIAKENLGTLTVPKGDPVLVEVPTDVASGLWFATVRSTSDGTHLVDARTGLFRAGQLSATVRPPAGAWIVYVEVDAGPILLQAQDGSVEYGWTHSWAVQVTPTG